SELKILSNDVTKNASDNYNYNSESTALKAQLNSLSTEQFNRVSLFTSGASATTLAALSQTNAKTGIEDVATLRAKSL
ncbi:MAG: flagellin, partial [Opitutales bacterium]|nr:flagellin [Opitutales bacterium]